MEARESESWVAGILMSDPRLRNQFSQVVFQRWKPRFAMMRVESVNPRWRRVLRRPRRSEAQTSHVVGDTLGWTVPSGGSAAYTTWASSQNFSVGDVLVFEYSTRAHDVAQVTKANFDSCSSANPISLATTGPTSIPVTSSGDHYFICTVGNHCSDGQKLAISVSTATTSSPSPSGTTTSPPPPPPPSSSAPSLVATATLPITILSIAAALLH
ncbi:hypothetical protein U1Q18_036871 [Sarracenia purpurea var. burkii]